MHDLNHEKRKKKLREKHDHGGELSKDDYAEILLMLEHDDSSEVLFGVGTLVHCASDESDMKKGLSVLSRILSKRAETLAIGTYLDALWILSFVPWRTMKATRGLERFAFDSTQHPNEMVRANASLIMHNLATEGCAKSLKRIIEMTSDQSTEVRSNAELFLRGLRKNR